MSESDSELARHTRSAQVALARKPAQLRSA
jgi:hypothetical protein